MHRKKNEGAKKRINRDKNPTPPAVHIETLSTHLCDGVIPTPAAIHAAKKKRELARNSEDIISVQIDVKSAANAPLVSDDDDNSDEGESQTVRKFGPTNDTSKQMEVLSALDNADSGSDEEKFVEEQIYKGVYSFPKAYAADHKGTTGDSVSTNEEFTPEVSFPSVTFTPISVESLQSQLNCQLVQLRENQSSNSSCLCKLTENIQAADEEIISMDSHSQVLSLRYQFFQEIRCYVKDLLLCLTEKVCQTSCVFMVGMCVCV